MHPDWEDRVKQHLADVADQAYDRDATGPASILAAYKAADGAAPARRLRAWTWYAAAALLVAVLAVYRLPLGSPAGQQAAIPRLRPAATLRSARWVEASDAFAASAEGWTLVAAGAAEELVSPSGHIVLKHLPTNAMLAPGKGGPFVAWTTRERTFVWWHRGREHHLAPPSGSQPLTWTAVMAPDAPIVALEAYNPEVVASYPPSGIYSPYRGPIIWMDLATGRVLRRLTVGHAENVRVPVLLSSGGRHLLLSDGTLWAQDGRKLGQFAVPPSLATLTDTLGPRVPDHLIDGGRLMITNTTPGRSWTYYRLNGSTTRLRIATWFNPAGWSAGELVAPPWSAEQIVYAVPWSRGADTHEVVRVHDGRKSGTIRAGGADIEAATITQTGQIRFLAWSPGQSWMWLMNGSGDKLARILVSRDWHGRAWLSADGDVMLLQQGGTLRLYRVH